jgi:transcription termination/antitermination protein NusA
MQAMSGGPTTPIEQVSELGEAILEKLIAAGITTVEALADMTPEQLEEVPGIGEKTVEKISVAVRHYFGQYEEGEERPVAVSLASERESAEPQEGSMEKTPEAILAEEAGIGTAEEVSNLSAEDIADSEEIDSVSDAFSDADAREEQIELDNDSVDSLVNESQENSDEGIDDGNDRG